MLPPQENSYLEDRHRKLVNIIRQASGSQWINDYWDLVKDLFEFLGLQSDDPRLVISPRDKDLISVSINQRWTIVARPSKSRLGFIFPYDFSEIPNMLSSNINTKSWRFNPFKTEREETTPYFLWFQGSPKDLLTSTQKSAWQEAALMEAKRGSSSSHLRWHIPTIYQAVMDLNYRNLILDEAFSESSFNSTIQGEVEGIHVKNINDLDLTLQRKELEEEGFFDVESIEDARIKNNRSIVQRQGQSEFRKKLLRAYDSKCPITGCDVEEAIEAAHIIPYQGSHTNHITNGLPLRSDIHTLFDLYLLSIDPDSYEIVINSQLMNTHYHQYASQKLTLPQKKAVWPSQNAIRNHYQRFKQQS